MTVPATYQKQRFVEAESESLFFRRVNASPEWLILPTDPPGVIAEKLNRKREFLLKLYDGIHTDAFKQIEELLEQHVRLIDAEAIWDAIKANDQPKLNALTIERMGIVMFFQQFSTLESMIHGIDSHLATLGIPVDPDVQSPTGQADPDLQ